MLTTYLSRQTHTFGDTLSLTERSSSESLLTLTGICRRPSQCSGRGYGKAGGAFDLISNFYLMFLGSEQEEGYLGEL